MGQTRIFKLLEGYRDRPPADLAAIAETLMRLSQLVVDCPAVKELDINPLLADETGVIALDARIRIEPSEVEKDGPQSAACNQALPRSMGEMGRDAMTAIASSFGRSAQPTSISMARSSTKLSPEDIRFRFLAPRKEFSHKIRSPASPRSTMPAPWPSSL